MKEKYIYTVEIFLRDGKFGQTFTVETSPLDEDCSFLEVVDKGLESLIFNAVTNEGWFIWRLCRLNSPVGTNQLGFKGDEESCKSYLLKHHITSARAIQKIKGAL